MATKKISDLNLVGALTSGAAFEISVDGVTYRCTAQQIYDLVELCQKERNHIALRFLDWFVNEQLEEVSSIGTLLGVIRRAGEQNLLYVEDYVARNGGQPLAGGGGEAPA